MKHNRKVQAGQHQGMSPRQFAERLGMSYEWVRKQLQRRQITFVKLGHSVRILESELDRLIQANTVPARDEHEAR
jgi:excisionase family DNA binding protein